jgi:hypothetical protein
MTEDGNGNGIDDMEDTGPISDDLFADEPSEEEDASEDDQEEGYATQDPASGWSHNWVSISAGLVVGAFAALLYMFEVSFEHGIRTIEFGAMATAVVYITMQRYFEFEEKRQPSEEKLSTKINEKYNFLGSGIRRHLWAVSRDIKTGRKAVMIYFSERPPGIECALLVGIPANLFVLAAWGGLGFPGAVELGHAVAEGSWTALSLTGMVLVVDIPFLFNCWLEKPIAWEARTIFYRGKERNLNVWLIYVLPGVIFVLLVWWYFLWPWAGGLLHIISQDPRNIGWLLAIPSGIWTVTRFINYLDLYVMVDNNYLRKGGTGRFLVDDPKLVLPRSAMTDLKMQRGFFGTIFRYYIYRPNEQGLAVSSELKRLRIKHGSELSETLGG